MATTNVPGANSINASVGVTIFTRSTATPVELYTLLATLLSVKLPTGRGLPSSLNILNKMVNAGVLPELNLLGDSIIWLVVVLVGRPCEGALI